MSLLPVCHPSVLQGRLVGNSLFMKDHGSVIFQLNLIRKTDPQILLGGKGRLNLESVRGSGKQFQ